MKPTKMSQQPQQPEPKAAPAAAAPEERNDLVRVAPTPELNPRNRAVADIAKRANIDADAAATETMPEGDGTTMPEAAPAAPVQASEPVAEAPADDGQPAAETEAAATPQEQPTAAAAEPAPQAIPGINPEGEYEFLVDGAPVKIKGSQVIARVQKGEAADYRLNLASRLLDEAKRTAATPQQPSAQDATREQPAAQPPLDEAQLAHFIQFGTTEQAAEAIRALRAQRPETVTQQGLQTFMAQQLPRIVDAQLAFREGLAFVQKEYGDIFNDPDLRQLFFFKENAARGAGDKRNHVELYRAIGEDIRKKVNRPAPPASNAPTQQAPAQTIAQKQVAKANAPAAPRLAAARLEGGTAAVKPKTREEIISEMRKARGQHSLSVR